MHSICRDDACQRIDVHEAHPRVEEEKPVPPSGSHVCATPGCGAVFKSYYLKLCWRCRERRAAENDAKKTFSKRVVQGHLAEIVPSRLKRRDLRRRRIARHREAQRRLDRRLSALRALAGKDVDVEKISARKLEFCTTVYSVLSRRLIIPFREVVLTLIDSGYRESEGTIRRMLKEMIDWGIVEHVVASSNHMEWGYRRQK